MVQADHEPTAPAAFARLLRCWSWPARHRLPFRQVAAGLAAWRMLTHGPRSRALASRLRREFWRVAADRCGCRGDRPRAHRHCWTTGPNLLRSALGQHGPENPDPLGLTRPSSSHGPRLEGGAVQQAQMDDASAENPGLPGQELSANAAALEVFTQAPRLRKAAAAW